MIEKLLRDCRRRALWNEALAQSGWALAVFFAMFALVLWIGSPALDWWIPVTLGVLAAGWAIWRTLGRIPDARRVAILLDRRCGLADAVSTAHHFRESASDFAAVQRAQAENAVSACDAVGAFPLRMPRSAYAGLSGLLLVAALIVLRYGSPSALGPLAGLIAPSTDGPAAGATGSKTAGPRRVDDLLKRLGLSNPDAEQPLTPNAEIAAGQGKAVAKVGTPKTERAPAESGDTEGEASDSQGKPGGDNKGAERPGNSRDGSQQTAQAQSKQGSSSPSPGLISKMRDAMSNLMSKLKPQNNPSSGKDGKDGVPKGSQQASAKQGGGQKGGNQPNQKSTEKDGAEKSGDQDSGSDNDDATPGAGTGKSDQKAEAKPGSGTGSQDGSKAIQDAEQLAAMGKLSEIIGKRAKNLTGEMTVESESGSQQLRTAYSKSNAKHSAAGGDVTRDEVPVALQSYVQQYYEQVRKQVAGKPPASQASH